MKDYIRNAYHASKNFYDAALSDDHALGKLYSKLVWGGVNDRHIARRLLSLIPDGFSGSLLDVPAGTALFTVNRYSELPLADITCLDYSEDMLQQARNRFTAEEITNVSCVQGDVGDLPFEDETFDIVLSMNGFHAFPDKRKAFLETERVLKPGGIFLGCFYIRGECKRTDFFVRHVLAKKGWFTPPFQTFNGLLKTLDRRYSEVELWNDRSIACFHCIK